MPGGPSVPAVVRPKTTVETGPPQSILETGFDLSASPPPAIVIGHTIIGQKHRPATSGQFGEGGNHAWRQMDNTTLRLAPSTVLSLQEDGSPANQIDLVPIKFEGLG